MLKEGVTRAPIDAEKNAILESQCLGLIPLSVVALGKITLGLRALERELYMRFIYLPVYPSIAGKGKRGRNEYIKESWKAGFWNKGSVSPRNGNQYKLRKIKK